MRKILVGLLLISFVYMAFLGFLNMNSGEFLGCLTGSRTDCPGIARVLDFLNFHVGVYKVFSTAVFALVISLLLVAVCFFTLNRFWPKVIVQYLADKPRDEELKFNYFEKVIRWLALLILSPNLN